MAKINVKIICDNSDPRKGRTCFWKSDKILSKYSGTHNFEFISIAECLENESNPYSLLELFSKNCTDIIIVNWDSINGDPIYGSDKAFQFFSHYKPDMVSWVGKGGIIFLEAQASAWQLLNSQYLIFSEGIKVSKGRNNRKRECAYVNSRFSNNPVLKNIKGRKIELPEHGLFQGNWFSSKAEICSIDHCDKEVYTKRRLSQGWFEKYPSNFDPLLFVYTNNATLEVAISSTSKILRHASHSGSRLIRRSSDFLLNNKLLKMILELVRVKTKRKPVMLCKIIDNEGVTKNNSDKVYGAYILTSMYVGASSLDMLVDNILHLSSQSLRAYKNSKQEDLEFNVREFTKSVVKSMAYIAIVILTFGFIFQLLNNIVISYFSSDNMSIYSTVIDIASLIFTIIGVIVAIYLPLSRQKRENG